MSSPSRHTLRQLKLIVPGGAVAYHFGTFQQLWSVVYGTGKGWGRTSALAAFGSGFTTIALFIYVLLTPWIRGVEPDYYSWRESGILSSVIPLLTASIVVGWLLLVLTLGQFSSSGYVAGILGASAIYALIFGLLGLIPAPKVRRA